MNINEQECQWFWLGYMLKYPDMMKGCSVKQLVEDTKGMTLSEFLDTNEVDIDEYFDLVQLGKSLNN